MYKKKCVLVASLIVAVALLSTGCSSNPTGKLQGGISKLQGDKSITAQARQTEDFDSVQLVGLGNVSVRFADRCAVEVQTDANLQAYIQITVSGRTLKIDATKPAGMSGISPTQLDIHITLPQVKAVTLDGVGDISLYDGSAEEIRFVLSGTGTIDAQSFQAKNVAIDLNGVGDAVLWATDSLTGTLSGVGDIRYKGSPAVSVKVSGVGDVEAQ